MSNYITTTTDHHYTVQVSMGDTTGTVPCVTGVYICSSSWMKSTTSASCNW